MLTECGYGPLMVIKLKSEDRRKAFGDRLARFREAAGMSLADAAREFGISKGSLGHYETGERPVAQEMLGAFAQLYCTTVTALIADEITDEDLMALYDLRIRKSKNASKSELPDQQAAEAKRPGAPRQKLSSAGKR